MANQNITYKFYSRSQHILIMMHQGRRYKVKFSTPYNGVAYFFTSDESLAKKIRSTFQFRQGVIKEEAPMIEPVHEEAEEPEMPAPKAAKQPSWTKSMTGKQAPKAAKATKAQEPVAEATSQTANGEEDKNPAGGSQEMNLFETMKIEEVQTYMDAKSYLRDVVGVDANEIRTKEQVVNYCRAHDIEFPNYEIS